jgi:hypothetical protein
MQEDEEGGSVENAARITGIHPKLHWTLATFLSML